MEITFEVKDNKTNRFYTITEAYRDDGFDFWLENEEEEGMGVSEQNFFDVLDKYFESEL